MRSNKRLKEDGNCRARTGPVRKSVVGCWSPEEDKILKRSVNRFGAKNWKKISELVPNRTNIQCLHRWQKVLNPELVKGPWSSSEDNNLRSLCESIGTSNWPLISSQVIGRNSKQCRERWYNHLAPNIKRSPWTQEEEDLLMNKQTSLGNKWSQISKIIEGRTQNSCKNQYHKIMNRRIREQKASNSCNLGEIPSTSSRRGTSSSRKAKATDTFLFAPNSGAASKRKRKKKKSPAVKKESGGKASRKKNQRRQSMNKKGNKNEEPSLVNPPFPMLGQGQAPRYVGGAEMSTLFSPPQPSKPMSDEIGALHTTTTSNMNPLSSTFLPLTQQDLTPEVLSRNNLKGYINQQLRPNNGGGVPGIIDSSSPNIHQLQSQHQPQQRPITIAEQIEKSSNDSIFDIIEVPVPQITPAKTKNNNNKSSGGGDGGVGNVLDGNVLFQEFQKNRLMREYQQLLFEQQMQRQHFFANISNNNTPGEKE